MAQHIQLRQGIASLWTSTNPVLALAETGVETDTGRFKLGNGVSTWTALPYTSVQGLIQTKTYRSFGDGSDGNVTISSGTTFLTQDMYYNNLTLNGTGKLYFNGYKVFVKNTLDLTAAGVGAIQADGGNGGNASGSTGGSIATSYGAGSLGAQSPASAGSTGVIGAGTTSAAVTGITGNGGLANSAGSGGTGAGGAGAASGASSTVTGQFFKNYRTTILKGITLISGGGGGRGGGSGSGDGVTVTGGGGGAGGNGGGTVCLYANKIVTSASTSSKAISAMGGNGGNGGAASGANGGSGGGGAGGGGGWVYICYNQKLGPSISKLITVSGGMGGTSVDGTNGTASAGGGGQGGYAGRIDLLNIPADSGLHYYGISEVNFNPEVIGVATSGGPGVAHAGSPGGTLEVDL